MKSKPMEQSVFANLKAEKERMDAEQAVKKAVKPSAPKNDPPKKIETTIPAKDEETKPIKESAPEETVAEERQSVVVRISQKNGYFLKIMSVRKGLTQSEYMASLIQNEKKIIDSGTAAKPFEVQEMIPSKKGNIQKMFQLPVDTVKLLVSQSQYYGLNRSEYANYILSRQIEQHPEVV